MAVAFKLFIAFWAIPLWFRLYSVGRCIDPQTQNKGPKKLQLKLQLQSWSLF